MNRFCLFCGNILEKDFDKYSNICISRNYLGLSYIMIDVFNNELKETQVDNIVFVQKCNYRNIFYSIRAKDIHESLRVFTKKDTSSSTNYYNTAENLHISISDVFEFKGLINLMNLGLIF